MVSDCVSAGAEHNMPIYYFLDDRFAGKDLSSHQTQLKCIQIQTGTELVFADVSGKLPSLLEQITNHSVAIRRFVLEEI